MIQSVFLPSMITAAAAIAQKAAKKPQTMTVKASWGPTEGCLHLTTSAVR